MELKSQIIIEEDLFSDLKAYTHFVPSENNTMDDFAKYDDGYQKISILGRLMANAILRKLPIDTKKVIISLSVETK